MHCSCVSSRLLMISAIALIGVFCHPADVLAQIQADTTSNTKVKFSPGDDIQITGGRVRGKNLFHSFQEFSVLNTQTAQFENINPRVNTIFARITGASRSHINGTLKIEDPVNLIVINPNGIRFGTSAKLDLQGDFLATTGTSILFENGQSFSAIAPQNTQLLSVKTPIGIQFGQNPGSIINHARLTLTSNRRLSFLGGDVQFLGGKGRVDNGMITIAALGSNQRVSMNLAQNNNPFNEFSGVTNFNQITLQDGAALNTRFTKVPTDGVVRGQIQVLAFALLKGKNARPNQDWFQDWSRCLGAIPKVL